MGTVPTGKLERELRALYLRWLAGVPRNEDNLSSYIERFRAESTALISRLGGQTAALGALADFPVPKTLELSPRAGVIYDQMQLAAVQAGIGAGLQATDVARQMVNAGFDKSFRQLNRLARTETVSAYWKNQWDSVADLPLIVMVWGSEESKRTCDYCLSRDGLVVEDPNIRDHPNGRCTLIPTLRSQVKYKGTLQPDGSVDMDPRWADQKVKGAKAQVSAGETTAEQRDPASGKRNPAAPSKAQAAHSVQATPQQTDIVAGMRAAEAQRKALEKNVYLKGNYNEAYGWTNASRKAWTSYTEMGHEGMNQLLRDPKGFGANPMYDDFFTQLFNTHVDNLSQLISKNQLTEDIYVARGVTVAPGYNPGDLKPGDLFADPAFLSTTSNMEEALEFAAGRGSGANGWTFVTKAPSGTNAVAGADYQNEIVFKAGQQQRVTGMDLERRIVYTEMIP